MDFNNTLQSLLPIAGSAIGTAVAGPAGGVAGSMIAKQAGKMLGGNKNGGGNQSISQQAGNMGQNLGFAQIMQGLKAKKEANSLFPQYEDPRQLALLAEIQQKKKSFETGSAIADQLQNADQAQLATQNAIVKSTGGDVGGTIQGLLQSERNTAGARNQAFALGQQQQANYNNLYTGLLDQIAARKMELQLAKSQQKMAEWAQSVQNGNQNFLTGMTRNLQAPQNVPNNINDILNSGAKNIVDLPDGNPSLPPELNPIETGIA